MVLPALLRLFEDPSVAAALALGTIVGLLVGVMPGLSGRIGLLLALPWALSLEPFAGAVFLVALHSVVHTSSAIPAILFGVATSAAESATVVDGFPLTRANRGAEAIGGMLTGSMLGGVTGAIVLIGLVPIALPLVSRVAAPEIAMLALVGLASVASLASGNVPAAITTAALGVLTSTIGLNDATGTPRYTLGRLELWDGADVAAVIAGLFVIPELLARYPPSADVLPVARTRVRDVVRAALSAFSHLFLMIRASLIGILVGFLPGIGASAAVWLAYGHAAQTSRPKVPFGEGAIEGVIAAETANNSKEGGVLAPTLFFGIPGSSGMAILMAAFATMGIEVGPNLVDRDPGFPIALGWTILLANVIAVPMCLALTPTLVHLARLRRTEIVVGSLTIATMSVLLVTPGAMTIVQIGIFGAVGTALARSGWPRAPFVLGFVMGPVFESALARTVTIWGVSALARPGVLILLAAAVGVIAAGRRTLRAMRHRALVGNGSFPGWLAAGSGLTCLAAGATAIGQFPLAAAAAPAAAAASGFGASVWLLIREAIGRPLPAEHGRGVDPSAALLYASTLGIALVAGAAPAMGLLAGGGVYWLARRPPHAAIAVGVMAGIAAAFAAGSASLP